jgi:ubiquinone/menaquinone biosynthesis C-methylase UbiE
MAKPLRREFGAVDRTADPSEFVKYLDTVRQTAFFREVKLQTLAAMELHEGDIAVDVGCGTGEDVFAIAAQVAPRGNAIGIDISATMIATAKERARQIHSRTTFLQADACRLPFGDASIDAIRAERLLQHIGSAEAALHEMVRVVKKGGRVVIWEGDLDLFVIDAADYEVSRVLQRFVCDQFVNGAIGHRLFGMFQEEGLTKLRSQPLLRSITDFALIESAFDLCASVAQVVSQGLLDRERAHRWLEGLRSASRAGRFFSAIGGFIMFGLKE